MLNQLKQLRKEFPDADVIAFSNGIWAMVQGAVKEKHGRCTREEIRRFVPFPQMIVEHKLAHDRVLLKTKGKKDEIVILPEFRK